MIDEFKEYQHVERLGTLEVQDILLGNVYVFPKLDGTNASIWMNSDGELQFGSRKRVLTLEKDNRGFMAEMMCQYQDVLKKFFTKYPNCRLYGEWLVPHSLKTYRKDAWRKFYIFDVTKICYDAETTDIKQPLVELPITKVEKHLHYDEYSKMLDDFHELEYIRPQAIIQNPIRENIVYELEKNTFLIEYGNGFGEGVVLKNYEFWSKHGRQTWAKLVSNEFKEKHVKEMGTREIQGQTLIEQEIVDKILTEAVIEKVYAKIVNDVGWSNKMIPRLLDTVYYDFVREEIWEVLKKFKNPTINFKTLKTLTNNRVKQVKGDLF